MDRGNSYQDNQKLSRLGRPIRLEDKALIDGYLRTYPPAISDVTFTNIFCWAEIKGHRFFEHNGHIFISYIKNDTLQFFSPLGPSPEIMIYKNGLHIFEYQWNAIDETLASKLGSSFDLRFDQDNSDYIYEVATLATLRGARFDGKRNYIKRFKKLNPEVRKLESSMMSACLDVQNEWLKTQTDNPTARGDCISLEKSLKYFDELKLHGVAVFLDGKLAGFAIGEPLNATTYVEHFERALPNHRGLSQFLHHEFIKSVPPEYTFLNCEQDLGIEGLRIAKEGWYPHSMAKKYTLRIGTSPAIPAHTSAVSVVELRRS